MAYHLPVQEDRRRVRPLLNTVRPESRTAYPGVSDAPVLFLTDSIEAVSAYHAELAMLTRELTTMETCSV